MPQKYVKTSEWRGWPECTTGFSPYNYMLFADTQGDGLKPVVQSSAGERLFTR